MRIGNFRRASLLTLTALGMSCMEHGSRKDLEGMEFNRTVCSKSLSKEEISYIRNLIREELFTKNKELVRFEDDKDKMLDGKICRAYLPADPRGKPLYVLVLGHVEELNFPSEYSGIVHFYEKLIREEKGTVLLFRTGLATHELGNMISPDTKYPYEPNEVLKNTKRVIRDFIEICKPSELRAAGFSWGGGTINELAKDDNWRQDIPVKSTVMIDPISFGSFSFGTALRTRPEFKNSPDHKNFHIYQRKDKVPLTEWVTTLQGNYPIKLVKDTEGKQKYVKDERSQDVIWRVLNTSHLDIDDLDEVRKKAYDFLIN